MVLTRVLAVLLVLDMGTALPLLSPATATDLPLPNKATAIK